MSPASCASGVHQKHGLFAGHPLASCDGAQPVPGAAGHTARGLLGVGEAEDVHRVGS